MIKNKTILITGGAGFIGTHLVEELIQHENFLVIIDTFGNYYYSGKKENLASILKDYKNLKDYEIIRGDLKEEGIYNKIHKEIDLIFHLAAHAGVRFSIANTELVTRNNILSVVNVFEYAKEHNIEKVVFASSSSVYGNPLYTPVDEEHPKNPISPYAVSKLCGEHYADYYFREYDLPITSLRFYTVYGPRGRPDMAIGKFFNYIMNDNEITIYGDGEQLRDFTYVSDIVDGLILSGEKEEAIGQVFNLGFSSPITVNKLIEKMYSIANVPEKVKYGEKKKGDVEVTHSDTTKAKKMLNYHPKVDIDTGLRKTFEWYQKK